MTNGVGFVVGILTPLLGSTEFVAVRKVFVEINNTCSASVSSSSKSGRDLLSLVGQVLPSCQLHLKLFPIAKVTSSFPPFPRDLHLLSQFKPIHADRLPSVSTIVKRTAVVRCNSLHLDLLLKVVGVSEEGGLFPGTLVSGTSGTSSSSIGSSSTGSSSSSSSSDDASSSDIRLDVLLKMELALAMSCASPYVTKIHAVEYHPDNVSVLYDYIPNAPNNNGSSALYDFIHNEENLYTWGSLAHIMLHLAQGIQALHKCTVIHGNLKSSNVMLLAEKEWPLITDHGLRFVNNSLANTHSGYRMIEYCAPETLRTTQNMSFCDASCDVYSYGVILWEMSTRKYPFLEVTVDQRPNLLQAIANHHLRPRVPPNVPTFIGDIINLCLRRVPWERPLISDVIKKWEFLNPFESWLNDPVVMVNNYSVAVNVNQQATTAVGSSSSSGSQ